MIIKQALDLNTDQKKLLTIVKQKFVRKTIIKEEISNFESQGFIVSSKQKSKAIMKKLKPEIELGYYSFIQLFCEMGFNVIPNLPHSFIDETKDISDFGFIAENNECVLICYYLYSDTKKEISSFENVLGNIKTNYGELLKELKKIFTGDKKFKAVQVYEWLYKKRISKFDEMRNVSKLTIEQLKQEIALLGQYKTQMAADIITGRTNLSAIDYAFISDVSTDSTEEEEDAE